MNNTIIINNLINVISNIEPRWKNSLINCYHSIYIYVGNIYVSIKLDEPSKYTALKIKLLNENYEHFRFKNNEFYLNKSGYCIISYNDIISSLYFLEMLSFIADKTVIQKFE